MSVVIVDPNQPIPESQYLWAKGIGQFDIDSNTRRKYFLSFLYPIYNVEEHVLTPSVDSITLTDIVVDYLQIEEHVLTPQVDIINLRSVEHQEGAPVEEHELTASVDRFDLRSIVLEENAPVEEHILTPSVDVILLNPGAVDAAITEQYELTPQVNRISITADETINSLVFGSGQEGVWYDPSDLSTMFQDFHFTTPVTTDGDPVAVMLGKNNPGTPVLFNTNPTFSNWPTGFTATIGDLGNWVYDGVNNTVEYDGTTHGACEITVDNIAARDPNKYYMFVVEIDSTLVSGTAYLRTTQNSLVNFPSNSQQYTWVIKGSALSTPTLRLGGNIHIIFSGFYVYELDANPLITQRPVDRPVFRTDGTKHWLHTISTGLYSYFCPISTSSAATTMVMAGYLGSVNFSSFRQNSWGNGGNFIGLSNNGSTGAVTSIAGLPSDGGFELNRVPFAGNRTDLFNELYQIETVISTDPFTATTEGTPQKLWKYGASYTGGGQMYGYLEAEGMSEPTRRIVEDYMAVKAGVTL